MDKSVSSAGWMGAVGRGDGWARVIYVRRVGVDVVVVVAVAVMLLLFVHRRVVHDVIRRSKMLDDEIDIVIEGTVYRRIKAILFAEDREKSAAIVHRHQLELKRVKVRKFEIESKIEGG